MTDANTSEPVEETTPEQEQTTVPAGTVPADEDERLAQQRARTAGTEAATVAQPATPDYAGPGVLHEDGSVAPRQGEAPNIGGTEHVQ